VQEEDEGMGYLSFRHCIIDIETLKEVPSKIINTKNDVIWRIGDNGGCGFK